MFLKPTANPTPRLTPSPRVVLPAPPGSRSGSRGSGSSPGDPLPRRQHVAGLERVQQAQLDRVDVQRGSELVHLRLGGEARLYGAEAAHRPARRIVRVDRRRVDERIRNLVRPDRERGRVRRDGGRRGGVRAAVEQDLHANVHELPLAGGAVLAPDARGMPVHVAGERLLAVVDDLHRAVGVQREQCAMHLHRQVLATAERAADPGEMDPHLVERQTETRRHLRPVDVQPLRRDVDVDAAFAVRDREPRLGAEERLVLNADLVDAAHAEVAFRVRVAVADHHVPHDVRAIVLEVAVAARRLLRVEIGLLGRALHVRHGLERLVLDAYAFRRAARLLGMVGGDERDGLAVVEDAVDREHGLVGELEAVGLLARDVLVGEHRVHAGHRHGFADVDREDAGMRVRRAQRVAPEHARHDQVARVGELALHLRRRVEPRDELAHLPDLQLTNGLRHRRVAASLTASKIFA
jgi:hypothetical protein